MAFTEYEYKIINRGKETGKTQKEVRGAIIKYRRQERDKEQEEELKQREEQKLANRGAGEKFGDDVFGDVEFMRELSIKFQLPTDRYTCKEIHMAKLL